LPPPLMRKLRELARGEFPETGREHADPRSARSGQEPRRLRNRQRAH
jgi:hypothetical protein